MVDGAMATAPRTSSTHGFLILVRNMNGRRIAMFLGENEVQSLNINLSEKSKLEYIRAICATHNNEYCYFCSIKDKCSEVCQCNTSSLSGYLVHKLFEAIIN